MDVLQKAAGSGLEPGHILENLVTSVARDLGYHWVDDRASFLDVTLAAGKLQRAIHDFSLVKGRSRRGSRVLVTTVPGEQHVLGAVVGCRLLSLEGCDASLDIRDRSRTSAPSAGGYDIAVVAVPSDRSRRALPEVVAQLREAEAGKCPIVLVGQASLPDLADHVGADGVVTGVTDVLGLLDRGRVLES